MSTPTAAAARLGRSLRRRRRGEPPPDTARGVMLILRSDVLTEEATARQAVRRTADLAGDTGVVVVQVLRVHGYAWGLPNPGLLPNLRERTAAQTRVAGVIAALRRAGVDADGEILVTRHDAKAVARVAARRGVATVVVERKAHGPVRTFVEGDMSRALRRRLSPAATIECIDAG